MLHIQEAQRTETGREPWIGPAPWIETPPPGVNAQAAIDRGQQTVLPCYAQDFPLVVRRARGSVVEDVDGNRYLDLAAGDCGCAAGHAHPRIMEVIQQQAAELGQAIGPQCYAKACTALAEKLARLAPGRVRREVLFTNSGDEVVDAAFKLVRRYSKRKWVLAFQGACHGETMGALSLSSSAAADKRDYEPLVPLVAHLPYGDVGAIEQQVLQQVAAPQDVAAVFVKPILVESGFVVPPKNFLPKLRALCDRHGILLVCDETQTGMGRTGAFFACQHSSVVPDIILLSQGLAGGMPLGALIASGNIMVAAPPVQSGTVCGCSVSYAAALATVELLEGNFIAGAAKCGTILFERLKATSAKRKCVSEPRGLGTLLAVDLVSRKSRKADPRLRDRVIAEAFRRGLILPRCGTAGIRFCPPLSINATQIEVAMNVFDEVVATVAP
jgi:4-aminobutyrate aminotransferase